MDGPCVGWYPGNMALMPLPRLGPPDNAALALRFAAAANTIARVHVDCGVSPPPDADYAHGGITRVPFLLLIENGRLSADIREGTTARRVVLRVGSLLVHAPGAWLGYHHHGPCTYLRLTFDTDHLLAGWAIFRFGRDRDDPNDFPPLCAQVIKPPPPEPIPGLVRSLLSTTKDQSARRRALARALFFEIASVMALTPNGRSPAEAMRAWISEHGLRMGLGRKAVAKAFACSPGHVSRVLKKWGGVAGEIERVRLERAIHIMQSEPRAILAHIAEKCGFVDASHFTKRFRKRHGMTPSAWRKAHVRGSSLIHELSIGLPSR